MSQERTQTILETIIRWWGSHPGAIDPAALAAEIATALADPAPADLGGPPGAGASPKGAYARTDGGKVPAELNASNDDGEG